MCYVMELACRNSLGRNLYYTLSRKHRANFKVFDAFDLRDSDFDRITSSPGCLILERVLSREGFMIHLLLEAQCFEIGLETEFCLSL